MAERDPRAPRIRPVRTVNHVRPDYGGNVDVAGYDDSGLVDRVEELEARTAGHIIRDEGDDLPQRPWLDFVGEGVTVTDFGGVTRVSIPGDGSGGVGADDGHIDVFTGIVGDTVADFVLTYRPRNLTWNVDVNGVQQTNGVDYSIAVQTLTVTDPTDLFLGASEGDPWTLQVQYHKASNLLTPEPEPPGEAAVGEGLVSAGASLLGTLNLDIPDGTQIGDLMMAHFATTNSFFLATVPDGWELEETREQTGGGGLASHIFTKIADAADIGDTVTWTASDGNLCGGMVTFPGGSAFTLDANQAVGTDVDHPAVTIPTGGCAWYVLGVGHDFSGGATLGAATGTPLWANDATFQASASAQQLTAGAQPAIESNFSVSASLIAYSIVVT